MNPASDLLDQIRAGTATYQIREYAAQGVLPLTEEQMIPLQIFLTKDKDLRIARTALNTLQKVSDQTWIRMVSEKDPLPEIVDFCLEYKSFPAITERILLNHSVPDEVVRNVASKESGALIDVIINNQVRLLRDPLILAALESNAALNLDQKRRIEEFKTEFIFKKAPQVQHLPPGIEQTSFEDLLAQIPNLDLEAQRIIHEADMKQEALSDEEVEETIKNIFSVEDMNHIPEETLTVYQRILKMKQGEKIRIALLGTKEERSILIRDSSRQVASMVLRSPKLTDPEIEGFAQMRNLDSDLLRQMGMSREFTKRYSVIHTLVKNPKTPSPISLNLLKLLREADLRNLARDKNIPELIRRQAQRLKQLKEAGKS